MKRSQKRAKSDQNPEVEQLKNQLVRALADYDNLQKRIERERSGIKELISAQLLARLLPIFDMFEHVQKNISDPGLAIAIKELDDKLKEEGFVKISPKLGDEFIDEECEAIEAVEDKAKKPGEIVEVLSTGYKLENGFIIRPAKVKVVRGEK